MFKKKSNLPPRPKCPTTHQMVEDLSGVTYDDPVFEAAQRIGGKSSEAMTLSGNEAAYQKITRFFKSHEDLKEVMKSLNSRTSNLNEKQCDMMKMTEELKNQAIKALI